MKSGKVNLTSYSLILSLIFERAEYCRQEKDSCISEGNKAYWHNQVVNVETAIQELIEFA